MTDLSPEIVTCPDRIALVMARDYTVESRAEIPKLYDAYFSTAFEIEDTADDALLGISFNMDGKGAFRYGVGRMISAPPAVPPDRFEVVTLPASDYAVFRHFGPVSELPVLFDRIFSEWLPNSGYAVHGDPVMEKYPHDSRNGPDGMAFEIWAPVRR